MRLIGRYNSPFVRRVAITLAWYDMPFELQAMQPFGDDKAKLRSYNPLARVPVLELANLERLIDSAVILDYLDELAGDEKALTPRAGPKRRRVQTLTAVALGATDKLVDALYEYHFRPKDKIHKPWVQMCEGQVVDGFAWLEEQLVGPWFAGVAPTQADITVAVMWSFGCARRPSFFARMSCPKIAALAEKLEASAPFAANPLEAAGLPAGISLGTTISSQGEQAG